MRRIGIAVMSALWVYLATEPADAQMGHQMEAAGPVNQSMAGAGTATALDPMGAVFWNPASTTELDGTQAGVSLAVMFTSATVNSRLEANALGPVPMAPMQGSTDSTKGPSYLPTLAVSHALSDQLRLGAGLFAVAGGGVKYPSEQDPMNPITMPQPPRGFGFGTVSTAAAVLQLAPFAAYKITDFISVGVAPLINYTTLAASPYPAAPPDDTNGDGFPTFPNGPKATSFGAGIQGSVFAKLPLGIALGASIKSPQWQQSYNHDGVNENGTPRTLTFNLDQPMSLSLGAAFQGVPGIVIAADVRYIDYGSADGFSQKGIDPMTGALRGLSWSSIFGAALGAQWQALPVLAVRAGYSYGQQPFDSEVAFYNIGFPALVKNAVNAGVSYNVTSQIAAHLAYHHGFSGNQSGNWITPRPMAPPGPNPGTSVSSRLGTDSVTLGIGAQF